MYFPFFQLESVAVPIQVSFAFTKNFHELIKANQPYEEEFLKAKEKFKEDDQGFLGAITELQNIEAEVPVHKVPIARLLDANISMTPKNFEVLKFMFEEEENGSI